MESSGESWLPIEGYHRYYVSSLGRITRCHLGQEPKEGRDLMIKPRPRYAVVSLSENSIRHDRTVHAIVCETFHGPKPSKAHQVAHTDGNPLNNASDNLRWVTAAENCADRERHGRTARGAACRQKSPAVGDRNGSHLHPASRPRGGANGGGGKLISADVLEIRAVKDTYPVLAKRFGVSISCIQKIKLRLLWKHL